MLKHLLNDLALVDRHLFEDKLLDHFGIFLTDIVNTKSKQSIIGVIMKIIECLRFDFDGFGERRQDEA